MPISSPITLAVDSILSNTDPIRIPNIQILANLGNLGAKLKQQTTVSDVVNKGVGDGHVQKENSHTTKDKIKRLITVSLRPVMEIMRENRKPGNMKNLMSIFP